MPGMAKPKNCSIPGVPYTRGATATSSPSRSADRTRRAGRRLDRYRVRVAVPRVGAGPVEDRSPQVEADEDLRLLGDDRHVLVALHLDETAARAVRDGVGVP